MNLIAIIPHYCHSQTIDLVVKALQDVQLPILIVDDGSDKKHHKILNALASHNVHLLYLPQNGGKGHAVKAGLLWAKQQGYSHALQIDADAQHHFPDITKFIRAVKEQPKAVICGRPIYSSDAPKSRLHGRKITNFWNIIHTHSFDIYDGMCGFRIYPIDSVVYIIQHCFTGNRMDFDNEILIHLYWLGLNFIWIDTPIRYEKNGISHFHTWKDNWLISKMHNRLFWQMIKKSLFPHKKQHWSVQQERGNYFFLHLSTLLVRYLPVPLLKICTFFIVCYFYLTSPLQRRHIATYQQRLQQYAPQVKLPKHSVFKQFISFAQAICDRFAVWQGKIVYTDLIVHDPDQLYDDIRNRQKKGQLLICSHLGNIDICSALVTHHQQFKLNILVHTHHAPIFNKVLNSTYSKNIQFIQISELDVALMLQLAQKLEVGEWIAIAADRTPIRGEKTITIDFLGEKASFPQGAWLLSQLLKAATNTIFALKQNGKYHLYLQRFLPAPQYSRHTRHEEIIQATEKYSKILANYAQKAPLQWFNFYDFWNDEDL